MKPTPSRMTVAVFAATLILAVIFDARVLSEVSAPGHETLRNLASLVTNVALGGYWITAAALLVVGSTLALRSQLTGDTRLLVRNLRLWALHLFLALVTTGLLVLFAKVFIGRARPSASIPGGRLFQLTPFSFAPSHQSLPSGHTQVIFCVATFLAYLWPRREKVLFGVALLIALTRVLVLKHYVSDVIVGMWIGIYGSYWSVHFWRRWVHFPGTVLPQREPAIH